MVRPKQQNRESREERERIQLEEDSTSGSRGGEGCGRERVCGEAPQTCASVACLSSFPRAQKGSVERGVSHVCPPRPWTRVRESPVCRAVSLHLVFPAFAWADPGRFFTGLVSGAVVL